MNGFALSTELPAFDTAGMVHRARCRRTALIAGVATALIVAGGATALASMSGASQAPAKPAAVTVDHDKATFLLGGVTKEPIPVDLTGVDVDGAKGQLLKAELRLGTIVKVTSPGCEPATVVEPTPHSPKIVSEGDTVNVKLCAG